MGKGAMELEAKGAAKPLRRQVSAVHRIDRRQEEARVELMETVEHHVIPRLVLAHAAEDSGVSCSPADGVEARERPSQEEVVALADIAADQRLKQSLDMVERMVREGLSLNTVMLELIAPAARLLGDGWLDDTRRFSDVTVGLGVLQRVVQVLGASRVPATTSGGLVVMTAVPNEQHTLGVYLVSEMLRQAGWGVHCDPRISEVELLDLVASERVVMVGLSASDVDLVKPLRGFVRRIRQASINKDLMIFAGGPAEIEVHAERAGAHYCPSAASAIERLARLRRTKGDATISSLTG